MAKGNSPTAGEHDEDVVTLSQSDLVSLVHAAVERVLDSGSQPFTGEGEWAI